VCEERSLSGGPFKGDDHEARLHRAANPSSEGPYAMGTLIQRKRNRDDIDVVTKDETVEGSGIRKRSDVTVHAADNYKKKGVKLGVKILIRQAVKGFKLNGKELSDLYFSQAVTDELQAGFPPQQGEQWWGYFLTLKVKPGAMKFETVLHLESVVLQKPDSQTVPILACYEDQALNSANLKNILQGHSVFVAPNPPAQRRRRR